MPYRLLAGGFVVLLVAYFVEIIALVRALKANGIWKQLGAPDLFSPVGQARFFSIVLGRDQAAFGLLGDDLKRKSQRIRLYMILGLACFVSLAGILMVGNTR